MPELTAKTENEKEEARPLLPGSVIGIFGGGQLGRMTALAAARLGFDTHIFCPKKDSPAFNVSKYCTQADYEDEHALKTFADSVDVATFEFENVPHKTIALMESLLPVRPGGNILRLSQNRLREKRFVQGLGIKTPNFLAVSSFDDLCQGVDLLKRPCILKTTEMGYDGKGQIFIDEKSSLEHVWKSFNKEGILEQYIPFKLEVSSIIARGMNGDVSSYDIVQNIHKNGILDTTLAPADIPEHAAKNAAEISKKIAEKTNLVGILAVEFFVTEHDELLFNEMAPRPHNSGHWTQDGCVTCQFEQFVRAVCGLELGNPQSHTKIKMKNLIGDEIDAFPELLKDPYARIHLYGKEQKAKDRKMGHVNYLL